MTTVHHPFDARIWRRQLLTLLEAGWQVSYAAPFSAWEVEPPKLANLQCVDLPRSVGRRRLKALRAARVTMRSLRDRNDLVLIHDLELLLISKSVRNLVWDVHEDTAAALLAKSWLPAPFRKIATIFIRRLERWAEGQGRILLAEYAYQERFLKEHPVVPNVVDVPSAHSAPRRPIAVYLGTLTVERGAEDLVRVGRVLKERTNGKIELEVIGTAHGEAYEILKEAREAGEVVWHGFTPNDLALKKIDGALAGLSLLHDLPNYKHSMPTKLIEYMALGIPVITTPLPLATQLVDEAGGLIVPFKNETSVVDAILKLYNDPDYAASIAAKAYDVVRQKYDWNVLQWDFENTLRSFV